MELLDGTDLFEYIRKSQKGIENIGEKKLIMNQLLNGLHFLHQNNIYHRDIKPENIFITRNINGQVNLDFYKHKPFSYPFMMLDFTEGMVKIFLMPLLRNVMAKLIVMQKTIPCNHLTKCLMYTKINCMWSLKRIITHPKIGMK